MTTYQYTGTLSDFAEAPIASAVPRLWVSPARPALSDGGGVLADRRIPITVNPSGTFSVPLVASVDTTPATQYILRCEWLTVDSLGQELLAGWSEWIFVAAVGGGPISEMSLIPISRIWVGDNPPARPARGLWWLDTSGYPYIWKEWVE